MKKSSLYKGCLEPIIINLLEANERMYGYEITQRVKEITKGELSITEGALYPLLHRLEADNTVESETVKIGSRVRKYYSLTPKGKKESVKYVEELKLFLSTMNQLLNPKNAASC